MNLDIFGMQKDERIDSDWHLLVETLENAGWQRESFTTLYETGNLFIPDAPEAEMSCENQCFIFNVTAFLSERKLYLSLAPNPDSGLDGQLTVITRYNSDLALWLEQIAALPQQICRLEFQEPFSRFLQLFPDSFLEMPIDDDRVSVPVADPIARKVLASPWCSKGPCHELALEPSDLERLHKMAKLSPPW